MEIGKAVTNTIGQESRILTGKLFGARCIFMCTFKILIFKEKILRHEQRNRIFFSVNTG